VRFIERDLRNVEGKGIQPNKERTPTLRRAYSLDKRKIVITQRRNKIYTLLRRVKK
jgi:hypothetical protein